MFVSKKIFNGFIEISGQHVQGIRIWDCVPGLPVEQRASGNPQSSLIQLKHQLRLS